MTSGPHNQRDEHDRSHEHSASGQHRSEESGKKMSRSEAGSKGGHSESHEEHVRAGSQSHKNDNR